MNGRQLIAKLERANAVDGKLETVQQAVATILDRPLPMDLLSGRVVGHPLHPASVQVPLGCWVAACALDTFGSPTAKPAARLLIGLGVASAVPSVLTGLAEWVHTREAERRVGAVHAIVNGIGTACFTASWVRRRSTSRGGRAEALLGLAVVGIGGWLGGYLAYARGVGVSTTAFLPVPRDWVAVAHRADVTAGSCHGAEVNGVAVALAELPRDPSIIVAMESRCTHRGGPLHEGPIEGDCVRCPWHGSLFDLATGAARRGPASVGQLVYETRVVDGEIEIMGDDPGGLRAAAI